MATFKRIFLFLAVNILVMITINVVLHLLGVGRYIQGYGLDYTNLAIFCLVWGTGGAFISLLLSKVMAKWMMGVQIVSPDTRDPELQQLVQSVHSMARAAGLP
jgi:heat shock protein HtpX